MAKKEGNGFSEGETLITQLAYLQKGEWESSRDSTELSSKKVGRGSKYDDKSYLEWSVIRLN